MERPTYDFGMHLATSVNPFTGQAPKNVHDAATFSDELQRVTIDDEEVMVCNDIECRCSQQALKVILQG